MLRRGGTGAPARPGLPVPVRRADVRLRRRGLQGDRHGGAPVDHHRRERHVRSRARPPPPAQHHLRFTQHGRDRRLPGAAHARPPARRTPPRGPHLRRDAAARAPRWWCWTGSRRTPTRKGCSTSPRSSAIEVRSARFCSCTVSRPPSKRWRVASPRAAFRRCTRRPRGSACGCEASQVAHGAHGRRRPPPVRRGRRARSPRARAR